MRKTMTIRRRALSAAFAALAACALALALVPQALAAAQGVTRQLDGINYTLPSDWEQVDAETVLDELTGIADVQGVDLAGLESAVFSKDDGFFLGVCVPDVGDMGDEDADELSAELAALAAYVQAQLEGTPLATVGITGAVEQGCPTLTASTTDISLNGVTYALTAKLFLGTGATGEDAVLMLSFLPASGQVTEGFADSLPVLDAPSTIEVSGISYDVPAGVRLAAGRVFGYDFAVAGSEEPERALFAVGIPSIDEIGDVTTSDLATLAEDIYDAVASDDEMSSALDAFWSGAYDFVGFPTIGVEGQVSVSDDDAETYFCLTVSFTSEGISLLAMAQDADDAFADEVLASAAATAPSVVPGVVSGEGSGEDAGFVVGLPAA